MYVYIYIHIGAIPLSYILTCAFSPPDFAVDDAEGMKQENEFQRITLISLRSPTSGTSRLGKLSR